MKIYVVEDDENIRELVIYSLNASGYEAEGIGTGKRFMQRCRQRSRI